MDTAPHTARGGTVEPGNRAALVKALAQMQAEPGAPTPPTLTAQPTAERYELRDPFAEVTYRTNNQASIQATAAQLGANRYTAINPQGQRTQVHQLAGQWQREAAPAPTAQVQPLATPDLDRSAHVAQLQAALAERYQIKRAAVSMGELTLGQTEYRYRGDTTRIAFTETAFRLATDTNNPSVARSMVDAAQARQWQGLRVSGSEDFKRLVWLEATVRGLKTQGYQPTPADQALAQREQQARHTNRIEPSPTNADATGAAATPTDKASGRGSGGRKAVLVAIEAILVARRVPQTQREAIMAAAADKLAQRLRDGVAPKVRVYDKTAPAHREPTAPTREPQRTRERAAPAR